MNYTANTTRWQPGSIVYHDADAKKWYMRMEVTGYDPHTGECITRYLYPDHFPGMRGTFRNDVRMLHGPARFGMSV